MTVVFYVSLLLSSSSKNERSSKIYEQSLIASINQYEYLPALLSTDTLLINTLISQELSYVPASEKLEFITQRSGADAIYIMNLDGDVVATSNFRKEQSFLHRNYSFRPYFKRAISELSRQFYYAKGATTGIPGFFISNPISYQGHIIGVAVVKLTMERWESGWQDSSEGIITADENGVIILSSEDQWRYRSVGTLPDNTIAKINQQQQFSGAQHTSLYSDAFAIQVFQHFNVTFWRIDGKLYLTHRFSIPEIDWTLYSLVNHDKILFAAFIFFIISTTIALSFYLIRRERRHKLESIDKNRQLELSRKEELKAVIDNIHIGVTLFSDRGELLSINDHAKHLLFNGTLPHPEQRIYIDEIVNIDFINLDELLLDDVASPAYHEAYAFNKKGNIPVMFALSKVTAMDRSLYLMTIINITRRKNAEDELVNINNSLEDTIAARTEELHKAQATLIQKNKAAALGNMAATIVHELSQPLAAMNSSIAAVCAKISQEDWEGAGTSAERLNHLSNKMYNVIKLLKYFSHQDSHTDTRADIGKTLEDSLDIFKETLAEKQITLNYYGTKASLITRANPLKLDLVLTNIIKNAIDAVEDKEEPTVNIRVNATQDHKASITIADNGGGVDEKIMKNMFNPYFTTKEVGKGLGLGLSITYEIIQEYGGSIAVHNTKEGACFTIMLMLTDSTENTAANHESTQPSNTQQRRINHG